MKKFRFALILLAFFMTVPAFSEKMRVAVLDLKASGVSDQIARVVSNMIRNELINISKFAVVERNQMNMILKEQGFQKSGCTDQECAVQIGKLMSARKMLVGEVSPLGKSLVITVRILDVEKGVNEYASTQKSRTEDELDRAVFALVKKLAARIQGSEPVRETETDTAALAARTTGGYYMRGIIPGWGQFYAGSSVKGGLFLGGFLLSGAFMGYAINDFASKDSAYADLGAGDTEADFDATWDDREGARTLGLVSIGIFSAVYIANLVDIFLISKPSFNTARVYPAKSENSSYITIDTYKRDNVYCIEQYYLMSATLRF